MLAGGAIAVAALGLGGGVASAAETPIWLVPGADLGSVLDPAVQLPTTALAPVFELLTFLAG
ncbi:hypothetical protein GCM10027445_31690 [Amycolatopsis endophytica]